MKRILLAHQLQLQHTKNFSFNLIPWTLRTHSPTSFCKKFFSTKCLPLLLFCLALSTFYAERKTRMLICTSIKCNNNAYFVVFYVVLTSILLYYYNFFYYYDYYNFHYHTLLTYDDDDVRRLLLMLPFLQQCYARRTMMMMITLLLCILLPISSIHPSVAGWLFFLVKHTPHSFTTKN